jgi:Phage integrase family
MILLADRHGLRASELCDVQWQQIELKVGRLHVRRSKKGARPRCIRCRATKIRALRCLQREQEASLYVFNSERGGPGLLQNRSNGMPPVAIGRSHTMGSTMRKLLTAAAVFAALIGNMHAATAGTVLLGGNWEGDFRRCWAAKSFSQGTVRIISGETIETALDAYSPLFACDELHLCRSIHRTQTAGLSASFFIARTMGCTVPPYRYRTTRSRGCRARNAVWSRAGQTRPNRRASARLELGGKSPAHDGSNGPTDPQARLDFSLLW